MRDEDVRAVERYAAERPNDAFAADFLENARARLGDPTPALLRKTLHAQLAAALDARYAQLIEAPLLDVTIHRAGIRTTTGRSYSAGALRHAVNHPATRERLRASSIMGIAHSPFEAREEHLSLAHIAFVVRDIYFDEPSQEMRAKLRILNTARGHLLQAWLRARKPARPFTRMRLSYDYPGEYYAANMERLATQPLMDILDHDPLTFEELDIIFEISPSETRAHFERQLQVIARYFELQPGPVPMSGESGIDAPLERYER